LPHAVAARELAALQRALGWTGDQLRTPAVRQNEGPGNALLATLVYEHVSEVVTGFGEKGVSAEHVASAVAREVMAFQASDGTLGAHLADQWMLPLALAVAAKGDGASFTCSEMTEHARTNMGVIEKFLAVRFMAEASGSAWRVGLARR
jgi:RNA 3'-terminal phosphate cyclase (ATP)